MNDLISVVDWSRWQFCPHGYVPLAVCAPHLGHFSDSGNHGDNLLPQAHSSLAGDNQILDDAFRHQLCARCCHRYYS